MNFRRTMCGKRITAVSYRIPAPSLPSLFGRHICGDIIDFQPADIHIIRQTVIMQKTSVGKNHRTVGFGGKDTLFRVINGVSQRIDVISPVLESGDILNIPFYIATSVRQFLPQISLDTHIKNIPVQPNPVTDTFLIEFRHILSAPVLESRTVFLHYHLFVLVERDLLHTFLAQYPRISRIIKHVFCCIIRPMSDLRHLLNLAQRAVCLLQLAFHVTSLRDIPILAKHHAVIRIHETLEIERLILQLQLEVFADIPLFPDHRLEHRHYLIPCTFRQKFKNILP